MTEGDCERRGGRCTRAEGVGLAEREARTAQQPQGPACRERRDRADSFPHRSEADRTCASQSAKESFGARLDGARRHDWTAKKARVRFVDGECGRRNREIRGAVRIDAGFGNRV